jgi:dTDP-4-amino-4,6-dideoxygalactose transaminase/nucleoside-diphosphate-sugar epimerase
MTIRPLITGALGFIGSRLVEHYRAQQIDVVGVDSGVFNGVPLSREAEAVVVGRRARTGGCVVEMDLCSAALPALLREVNPTHIVHLAALSRTDLAKGFARAVQENIVTTQALLDGITAWGGPLERLVLASSSMVYGDFQEDPCGESHPCAPRDPYGASKLACEALARAHGRSAGHEVWVVRPSAVYGPGDFNQRVVERFLTAALAGQPMTLYNEGKESLDFTFVTDLVAGLARALEAPPGGEQIFNLTAGDARTVLDLARIIQAYVPGATVELLPQKARGPKRGTLSIAKARRVLGHEPEVSLEEGVRRVLEAQGHPVPPVAVARVSPAPRVSLSRPSIGEEEQAAVARVLRRGWLAHGPETRAFEEEFSAHIGLESIAVSSGYSALYLALLARGIRGEVIVPAFTFAATANAVVLAGATPVFVDIEPDQLGLDPAAVAAALTPRTEAILPVHIAGTPCRIEELRALASRHHLFLLEDCAQAAGARQGGQQVGSFGEAGCFSFFPTKNMTTAEGGMLVTGDADLARRARRLSAHGIEGSAHDRAASPRPWHRVLVEPGSNVRMSALHAALGRVQLGRLDAMNARRSAIAARLDAGLAARPGLRPRHPAGASVVHSLYLVRLGSPARRDEIVGALRERGIEASVHYDTALVDELPYRIEGGFPVARAVAGDVLTLPLHPEMSFGDADRVAGELLALLGGWPSEPHGNS